MTHRTYKLASCLFTILILYFSVSAQERRNDSDPRMIDSYGDIPCGDTQARLDMIRSVLREHPSTRVFLIGYSGRDTPFDRLPYRFRYAKAYLEGAGIDTSRLVTINGGYREDLWIDTFIVPENDSPPIPTPTIEIQPNLNAPRRFDTGYIDFFRENGRYRFYCCDMCPLEIVDFGEYARILRAEPNLRAHIFIYFGYRADFRSFSGIDRRTDGFRTMARLLRNMLIREYGMDTNRITIAFGGGREFSEVELWVVPNGVPLPRPTPTHFQRRRRSR
jgi:hypothetical protein